MAERHEIRTGLLIAAPLALAIAGCGSDDGVNMLAPPPDALSEAQIERALGPLTAVPEAAGNETAPAAEDGEGKASSPAPAAEPARAEPPAEADIAVNETAEEESE